MLVNRQNDYFFRWLFGSLENLRFLARLLTVILGKPIVPEELKIDNPIITADKFEGKEAVLDILVERSEHHERMNVEMQTTTEPDTARRVLFYWSDAYIKGIKRGGNYGDLPKQINILIADFEMFDYGVPDRFHGTFKVLECESQVLFSDALEIRVLELEKLEKRRTVVESMTALECWMYYLNNTEGELMEQIAVQEPLLQEAMQLEEVFMQDAEHRRLYEMFEKGRRDRISGEVNAERRGMEKGREEGIAEGMEKGMEKGMETRNMEIAKNMLSDGMSPEMVAKYTGLSLKELKKLAVSC
jgi:predicted transposase/invertase (TIGR01784 family)